MNRLDVDPRKVALGVMERTEVWPETYDQTTWYRSNQSEVFRTAGLEHIAITNLDGQAWAECGTVACVAGHAVAAASELGVRFDSENTTIRQAAKYALGLSDNAADWLFCHRRSVEEVTSALNAIASGRDD